METIDEIVNQFIEQIYGGSTPSTNDEVVSTSQPWSSEYDNPLPF